MQENIHEQMKKKTKFCWEIETKYIYSPTLLLYKHIQHKYETLKLMDSHTENGLFMY